MSESFWDVLAQMVGMSREYTRTCAYVLLYGGRIDPWLDHIMRSAIDELDQSGVWG
jgi:hypothetical protein